MTDTTPVLGLSKPVINGDDDTWGDKIRTDYDTLDSFAGSLMPGAAPALTAAATLDIGAANNPVVTIGGTTQITSLGTQANTLRFVKYTAAVPLKNGAALALIGAADRTCASGDWSLFASDASGNWREISFTKGDGSGKFGALTCTSLTASGALSGASLAVSGSASISGALAVTGNVTFNGGASGNAFGSTSTDHIVGLTTGGGTVSPGATITVTTPTSTTGLLILIAQHSFGTSSKVIFYDNAVGFVGAAALASVVSSGVEETGGVTGDAGGNGHVNIATSNDGQGTITYQYKIIPFSR